LDQNNGEFSPMNVVIVGAGQTGRYISSLLSNENHNVILVDIDPKRLEAASLHSDIAVKEGSGVDWQLLDNLLELSPDLLVALTDDDATNLVSCAIAKNLGYTKTISRVRDNRYLNRTRLDFGRIFDVDDFIGPELLVANEIFKYMISPDSIRVETFAHGAVQLRTLVVPNSWRHGDTPISELDLPNGVMVGLIYRIVVEPSGGNQEKVIFPHGQDTIKAGDELTLIGETEKIEGASNYFGLTKKSVNSVVILGGSRTAVNLARILEAQEIYTRIIEIDYQKCQALSEMLPKTTIINNDGTDFDFLLSEKVGNADAFVVSTRGDEVNVLASLLGKEAGCSNVIVQLSNPAYIPIVQRLGVEHTASPRIIAANKIMALALSRTVTSLVSLYESRVEIMEIHVSSNSSVTGIPLSELGPLLPKDFLIGIIQNRGRVMVANGNHIISPGDTVIVLSSPRHRNELKKIF